MLIASFFPHCAFSILHSSKDCLLAPGPTCPGPPRYSIEGLHSVHTSYPTDCWRPQSSLFPLPPVSASFPCYCRSYSALFPLFLPGLGQEKGIKPKLVSLPRPCILPWKISSCSGCHFIMGPAGLLMGTLGPVVYLCCWRRGGLQCLLLQKIKLSYYSTSEFLFSLCPSTFSCRCPCVGVEVQNSDVQVVSKKIIKKM
jgi:hypothetical protein